MESRINTENRLSTMEQKIDNLTEDVKEIAKDIKEHIKWEGEKYEKLDNKYSGKWVEKAIVAIGTGVVITIISLIFK